MSLTTTTIGAYPKPEYVKVPDWFADDSGVDTPNPTKYWAQAVVALGDDAESVFLRGTKEAIEDQVGAGIDIPTDGEIRRENYIHYHCRHLGGIDFEQLTEKDVRGVYRAYLPTVVEPLEPLEHFLPHDWETAQGYTSKPVKITMPGPLTMADTIADRHYNDPRRLGTAIAECLNHEVLALAEAGCRHIQIDEPVFARKPREALEYGLDNLGRAFHGCPDHVSRTVHICCGYPDRIDSTTYPKAPPESYFELADAIEQAPVDAVSIEDAHRHNDLTLLERFTSTTVILGVVAIAKSRIESVEEIRARLTDALEHIDAARLIAAPDCGLGFLGRELAIAKLKNLSEAAHSLPE